MEKSQKMKDLEWQIQTLEEVKQEALKMKEKILNIVVTLEPTKETKKTIVDGLSEMLDRIAKRLCDLNKQLEVETIRFPGERGKVV